MRNLITLCLVCSLFIVSHVAFGQNPYTLRLKSGERVPIANVDAFIASPQVLDSEKFGEQYYKIVQFTEIPTQSLREEIDKSGLSLLSYITGNAYIASIPVGFDLSILKTWKVRSVDPIRAIEKYHQSLYSGPYPDWAMENGMLKVYVKYYEDLTPQEVAAGLAAAGIESFDQYDYTQLIHIFVSPEEIADLGNLPFVSYAELVPPPIELENYIGRVMHGSNVLASDAYQGRKYNGDGVDIGISDSGIIGPHIDYQGRIASVNTTTDNGNHGDHVSGIAAGAGNLNPKHRGQAFGANLHVYLSYGAVTSLPGSYTTNNLRITSTSLGNGCNDGYTTAAQTVDMQVRTLPAVMHVYSCGNSGTSSCGNLGSGWRTITGGNKSGKNVMAIGNLTSSEVIAGSSSRGPATDGRIKPDVTALGTDVTSTVDPNDYDTFTGTSMACPAVSGLLAQLYHAYRTLNAGNDPDGGLMKATLLNTAKDLGNPGPDFTYGWGKVNGRRAVVSLEEGRYLDSTISQGGINTHFINIPVGVEKAKIMLYWTDFEGNVMASPALVNDLDLVVADPNAMAHNPWLLDPGASPTVASVQAPATKNADHLNNMEQVEIDNPTPGIYSIAVAGATIPQGPQKYFLLYEFYRDEVVITYPIGGEGFVPFETERIRWEAWGTTGNFTVEYSEDNGINWFAVGTALGSQRHIDWTVPNTLSGQVKVRVTRGAFGDQSPEQLTIAPVPFNLRVTQVCQGYTRLEWDQIPNVPAYDVFYLGVKYMDSVGTTVAPIYDVTQASHLNENWFSVRAAIPMQQGRGRRAVAINQPPGLVMCAAVAPNSAFSAPGNGCSGTTYSLLDLSQNGPTSWDWDIQPSTFMYMNGTNANSQNPQIQFTSFGIYTVRLIASNFAGTDSITRTITIAQGTPTANFTPTPGGLTYIFVNNSTNAWFYDWKFGDGTTSNLQHPSHTYATGGTYTVTLVVTNPCGTFSTSQTVTVIGTGLEDQLGLTKAEVFPNPSTGIFNVKLEGVTAPEILFEITDMQGRRMQTFTRSTTGGLLNTRLDLSTLSKGIYFLNVSSGNNSGTVKLFLH